MRQQFLIVLACVLAISWSCCALLGPSVKLRYFAAKSRSADHVARWVGVEGLMGLGIDGIGRLAENLAHEDAAVRVTAAEGLRTLCAPSTLPILLKGLSDPDPNVRCELVDALGRMGDRTAIPSLIGCLGDSHGFVRFRAAIALDDMGSDAGVPEFIRHINHVMLGGVARERLERISQRRFGFDRPKWEIWWAQKQVQLMDARRFALSEDMRSASVGE